MIDLLTRKDIKLGSCNLECGQEKGLGPVVPHPPKLIKTKFIIIINNNDNTVYST